MVITALDFPERNLRLLGAEARCLCNSSICRTARTRKDPPVFVSEDALETLGDVRVTVVTRGHWAQPARIVPASVSTDSHGKYLSKPPSFSFVNGKFVFRVVKPGRIGGRARVRRRRRSFAHPAARERRENPSGTLWSVSSDALSPHQRHCGSGPTRLGTIDFSRNAFFSG